MLTKDQKKQLVSDLVKRLKESKSVVFVGYDGLTASFVANERKKLTKQGIEYVVVKNTLLERAMKETGMTLPESLFTQMTAIGFGKTDPSLLAKALYKKSTGKAGEQRFVVKGAIVDGAFFDEPKVERLALLPTRDELIAQVCRGMNGPVTGLAMALKQTVAGIAYALDRVREQKAQTAPQA
jgi:large subunit ribosomal protein L10